jgi:hypothetical protein
VSVEESESESVSVEESESESVSVEESESESVSVEDSASVSVEDSELSVPLNTSSILSCSTEQPVIPTNKQDEITKAATLLI